MSKENCELECGAFGCYCRCNDESAKARSCKSDLLCGGWQPIETAPKDRELILSPGGVKESSFIDAVKIGGWVSDDEHPSGGYWEMWGATWVPKYWMRKPAAPNT